MFSQFLHRWLARAPESAKQLGLAQEHEDIANRHARMAKAWASHLRESRATILLGARQCPRTGRALVIGAGDCLDVPVAELAEIFDEVVLADIVISRVAQGWAKKLPGKVRCFNWDASGALEAVAKVRETLAGDQAPALFAQADPGPPPGGEPDFIVSANCLSQLGLVPGHSLPAYAKDTGLPDRCARAAGKRHVTWLAERPAALRVLLTDAARLNIGSDGRQQKKETLYERFGLRDPDRRWRWDLAPIPEWSPDFHRVHEVGAWFDTPVGPAKI